MYILIEITDYKGGELLPPKTSKNLIEVLEETLDSLAQRVLYPSSSDEKIKGKKEINNLQQCYYGKEQQCWQGKALILLIVQINKQGLKVNKATIFPLNP